MNDETPRLHLEALLIDREKSPACTTTVHQAHGIDDCTKSGAVVAQVHPMGGAQLIDSSRARADTEGFFLAQWLDLSDSCYDIGVLRGTIPFAPYYLHCSLISLTLLQKLCVRLLVLCLTPWPSFK